MKQRNPLFAVLIIWIVLAAAAIGLAACTNPPQKPVSTEDYVQSAKAQIAGAYRSIGDLKATGVITAAKGSKWFADVDKVENDVRAAEQLQRGGADPATVKGKVDLALKALLLVQAELRAAAQQKPPGT